MLPDWIVAAHPYILTAIFGLAGTVIGGLVAGTFSLRAGRQAQAAAQTAWIRDTRADVYNRFLASAQSLLIACESAEIDGPNEAVESAHNDFFGLYGVIQTVAERPVVDAARVYAYRLQELTESRQSRGRLGPKAFESIAKLVRFARHDTIDAMRLELGLEEPARPPESFNPFAGTEHEQQWRNSPPDHPRSPVG